MKIKINQRVNFVKVKMIIIKKLMKNYDGYNMRK